MAHAPGVRAIARACSPRPPIERRIQEQLIGPVGCVGGEQAQSSGVNAAEPGGRSKWGRGLWQYAGQWWQVRRRFELSAFVGVLSVDGGQRGVFGRAVVVAEAGVVRVLEGGEEVRRGTAQYQQQGQRVAVQEAGELVEGGGVLPVHAVITILFTAALVFLAALFAAAVAGKLARLDGASYPAALTRAAAAFAAVLTLAAAVSAAIAPYTT